MNADLEKVKEIITSSSDLSDEVKDQLHPLIKKLDKELTILEFKLDRTEKVKRTTSVLLEETIDELEKKRKDVEDANTALKRSLDDLKEAQTQLIHAEKMASLGELTAGIAHEIQNPLNFVNNFSEVSTELIDEARTEMNNGDLEEVNAILNDLKNNLSKITHHGKRASDIVRSMLDHSRTSDGEKIAVDLNNLCDEYLRLAYHGMRARDRSFNATFETHFDPSLPEVKVIPQDMGRVLLNLINNAFQAISGIQKTPKVTVITKNQNDHIEIIVYDNGSGIPEEIKDKIFQPFFTTKPTGQGTGLGLSLSYDIVKSHGGKITVNSNAKDGTTFNITLPVK